MAPLNDDQHPIRDSAAPDVHNQTLFDSQHGIPSSTAPSSERESEKAADVPQLNLHHEQQTRRKRRRNICIGVILLVVILAIVIPVAVVFSMKKSSDSSKSSGDAGDSPSSLPSGPGSHNTSDSSIPQWARGGYLDTSDWYDTLDFNLTFTDEKVGGLYIMGLNSTWDDNTRANENVPPLNEPWKYGTMPFRGVNIGGWFTLEPFISPSLFDKDKGIVDEWTLCAHLGPADAKSTLEKQYSEFAQESTFAEIQAAGFDHIRIPFSYWAVTTYGDDPYVPMVSFRYLLRAIEWARKYGLRIFLDLHAVPGSQNGWVHSGRVGDIGWLSGPNGELNGERTIKIHKQLSTFFSQPRYRNIITLYALVNEPDMTAIGEDKVFDWYNKAIPTIRDSGYNGLLIMGDGFIGLDNWQGKMQGIEGLVLDVHQYAVYNVDILSLEHADKVDFACDTWTQQAQDSNNVATGFGPTMFGEWSYADTECALYQNGVGVGSRWDGTFAGVDGAQCPVNDKSQCSCTLANANPSSYSDEYKLWLRTFAEAQMDSFEYGWGWFHWTWKADNAPQWSYKDGLAAGILPKKVYDRSWDCSMEIPDFVGGGLPETY